MARGRFSAAAPATLPPAENRRARYPRRLNLGHLQTVKVLQTPQGYPVPKSGVLNTVSTKRNQRPRLLGEMIDSRAGAGNKKKNELRIVCCDRK